MNKLLIKLSILVSFFLSMQTMANADKTPSSAQQSFFNVLLYHHVADNTPFATTTKIEDFKAHLAYLSEHGFTVVDLVDATNAIQAGESVPEKSIAIVFDDAFLDIYTTAYPLLKSYDMPFSIFVTTEPVDKRYPSMLSWSQLKEMKSEGVAILNHTTKHDYLIHDLSDGWLDRVMTDINFAQQRLHDELGVTDKFFAYPYGEFNNALKNELEKQGYYAFGQHSGGIAEFSDFQGLARFPAAGHYANLKTLKTKINSRPLVLEDYQMAEMQATENPPTFTFTPKKGGFHRPFLQCFIEGKAVFPTWDDQGNASLQASKPLNSGRSRYNCTVPAQAGGYYWLSQPWLLARENGVYPKQ
jgi:peptidoglycan/xylan/chitin deacetylase (PgdA/CDA1 family)